MSQEHLWSCGKCGARVVAKVGEIERAFQTHALACPTAAHQRKQPGALPPDRPHLPPVPTASVQMP